MKKALMIVFFAIVVVGTVYYGIHRKETGDRQMVQQNLITAIENKKSGNEQVTIDFKQLTNFSWDRVYIFTPYSPEHIINKQLGFNWSKADLVKYSDSINLIVFVKGKKVVQYVEFPRAIGEFIVDNKNEFAPNEKVKLNPLY